jgi:peptide-methionine (S)-S-oxide reductase
MKTAGCIFSSVPALEGKIIMAIEIATLGGGCFWCTEAVYQQLNGVEKVESGYSGGRLPDPTYEQICEGNTGHAEVIRLQFDNTMVSYRDILEIFFTIHDPTTLNRQGNDVGTQYRSVIYTHSDQQMAMAREVIAAMAHVWDAPIVTELQEAPVFYPAEAYHQNYFLNHPMQSYCAFVVAPKVTKFRQVFASRAKKN